MNPLPQRDSRDGAVMAGVAHLSVTVEVPGVAPGDGSGATWVARRGRDKSLGTCLVPGAAGVPVMAVLVGERRPNWQCTGLDGKRSWESGFVPHGRGDCPAC